jgi:acyl-coenzyme A thioesterase PaaI-like protein
VTGKAAPSIEFKTNFIAAARPGKFIATGSVVRAGKSIAFTETKMSDSEENLIATAAVTSQLVAAARLVEKANAK